MPYFKPLELSKVNWSIGLLAINGYQIEISKSKEP